MLLSVTVKQCAEELGLSQLLVRELLKTGLLAGEKKRGGWVVADASVEALRRAALTLRSALPGAHDEQCWSWLYEPDVEITPAKPWQAPMPANTGAWLGEQEPEPQVPHVPEMPEVEPAVPPPTPPEARIGPPCALCSLPMVLRMMDADLGEDWFCPECQVSPSQETTPAGPPAPAVHAWHAADFEILEIVRKSAEPAESTK